MRDDAVGLFWEELPKVKGKGSRGPKERGPMPPIPETGWTPVTEFPNLSAAKVIGLDTETYDPELTQAGPGWGRGRGHIIGASISVDDGTSWYFPIRHGIEDGKQVLPPEQAAMNMDPDNVLAFLRHTLQDARPKVGANLIYDVGWLAWEGVPVGGRMYDVQFAEALLNSETPDVSLDSLGETHLGRGKETNMLYDFLSRWCGGAANDRQRKNLYLSPPSLAGPYAESDASLPVQVLSKQWPLMHHRGVLEVFDMECRLIPLLVKMRMKGAPVRLDKAEQAHEQLGERLVGIEKRLTDIAGQPVNPAAAASVKAAFESVGLEPTTKKNAEGKVKMSFDKPRLAAVKHPLTEAILEWRKLTKVRDTFIKSYILDKHVGGRIYGSFHPLKNDDSGARSGRFASSDPNLQNIPIRSEEGKLVRKAFGIDPAHGGRWRSFDYSSIEYRLLVHFAVGPGSDDVRMKFRQDPHLDYHQLVAEMIEKFTAIILERTKVKNVNFGIIYGMQLNALTALLGVTKAEAKRLLDAYHQTIPYAKETMDLCANEVHTTGVVRTILNRANDFTSWGQKGYVADRPPPLSYEAACRKWGMFNIERQETHKALNRKLQGSAADVMKTAMVNAYESGLFDEDACGIPCLTVHDELDFEDLGDLHNPAWGELQRCMEGALSDRLRVPLVAEGSYGETWADAH
ncbi:MAG: hypothetical protein FKY71_08625 [Spiribacter salinus]|uniref:DNA-directed DNA polymerase n=1 Tax=Spiribacter salinus TaxID=1335746 RepID=A0A540VRN4_9GAMM|nr:MAG: hypothetical protein FKY71_08625 [Spiribacter salinus]